MKVVEQKSFMSQLKDVSIITAASVTIVGTILWLKRETAMQQLREEAGAEQMRIRTALERLAAAVERVEGHLQDLIKESSAKAEQTGKPGSQRTVAANATANGTGAVAGDKPTAPRRSRKSTTSNSKNGTNEQKGSRRRSNSSADGDTASNAVPANETSTNNPTSGEAA